MSDGDACIFCDALSVGAVGCEIPVALFGVLFDIPVPLFSALVYFPIFAKGQIDGYFENQVPEEFWKLFALYFATSAITSIVWAKYWAPDELDSVMALNKSVLNMFDGMDNPIPRWYRE